MRCKICGSEKFRHVYKKDGFNILKCVNCLIYFVSNPLNEQASLNYYKKLYHDGSYKTEQEFKQLKINTIKTLQKYLPEYPGKALDIGCGEGLLVDFLRNIGWDVIGVDPSSPANNLDNLINRKFEDINLQENNFDLITMIDSFEHFKDPVFVLKKIHKLLKNSGKLLITTPNIRSIFSRLLGKYWVHLRPREHLHYFSPFTLRYLLSVTGFKIQKIGKYRRCVNLHFVVNRIKFHYPIIYSIIRPMEPLLKSIKSTFFIYSGELFVIATKADFGNHISIEISD